MRERVEGSGHTFVHTPYFLTPHSSLLTLPHSQNTTSTAGLNLTLVDQIIELGSIGRGYSTSSNSSTFYLHTQPSSAPLLQPNGSYVQFGDSSSLVAALQQAAQSTTEQNVRLTCHLSSN